MPAGAMSEMGPTSSGRKAPMPPPSMVAGPPIAMSASSVAMMRSVTPRIAALPA